MVERSRTGPRPSPPAPKRTHKQQPARGTNRSRQRLMAEPNSCDSQTWPNISSECIAGRAEPAKVVERAPLVAEQPSSILLRPTKLPEAVPDPEVTGALPLGEQLKVRDSELAVGTVKTAIIEVADRAAPEPAQRLSDWTDDLFRNVQGRSSDSDCHDQVRAEDRKCHAAHAA